MSIVLSDVTYTYDGADRPALFSVSTEISESDFVAVIGPTGSGKSTLVMHLNGLLTASSGDVLYEGESIYGDKFDRRQLRGNVGLLFQYPEYQLFESTVFDDVAFGPKCLGLSEEEANSRTIETLDLLGVPEEQRMRSPFELSGGQRRRIALAGVLAMRPKYLILDEPAAGLDPAGKREIFSLMKRLHEEHGIGIVLVSHCMEDVAEYADRVIAMKQGRIVMDGPTRDVFAKADEIETLGLDIPAASSILRKLKSRGMIIDDTVIKLTDAAAEILKGLYYNGR